jgi:hypothetical protein
MTSARPRGELLVLRGAARCSLLATAFCGRGLTHEHDLLGAERVVGPLGSSHHHKIDELLSLRHREVGEHLVPE